MPTLEPIREGFTQSGVPSSAQRSRQPVFADLDEVHLRDPLPGEQPLQRQLVHAGGRGEDVGADVGQVEHLQQPLHAAVLAEGRRGGPGRRRRRRAGRRRGRAPPPPPRRSRRRRGRSAPRPPRGRLPPGPSITEAPEFSETSCSEERPPVSTATLTAFPFPFDPFEFFFFRASTARALADDQRHFRARRQFGAAGGRLARDQPDLFFVARFFFLDHRREPGGAHRFHRFAAFQADHARHLLRFPPGGDDDLHGRPGFQFLARALGDWLQHLADRRVRFLFADYRRQARGRGSVLHRDAALLADQDRHLDQLRPGGDEDRHGRAVRAPPCPPAVRS